MPPKREAGVPRAYGRQASDKTIKSLSLEAKLAAWAEEQAHKEGISFSAWIERHLRIAQLGTDARMVLNHESQAQAVNPQPHGPITYKTPPRPKKKP